MESYPHPQYESLYANGLHLNEAFSMPSLSLPSMETVIEFVKMVLYYLVVLILIVIVSCAVCGLSSWVLGLVSPQTSAAAQNVGMVGTRAVTDLGSGLIGVGRDVVTGSTNAVSNLLGVGQRAVSGVVNTGAAALNLGKTAVGEGVGAVSRGVTAVGEATSEVFGQQGGLLSPGLDTPSVIRDLFN